MTKEKCKHLICCLKHYGKWVNVNEKQYLQFFYAIGAISMKYDILSRVDKNIKRYKEQFYIDDMGIEWLVEYKKKECLAIGMNRFAFCPRCGEKIAWDDINERQKALFNFAKSRVDEQVVISRHRKRKLKEEIRERRRKLDFEENKKKQKKNCGYVYLVKLDKHYKIGISVSPDERLKEFTLLPYELENILILKVKDYDKREKELHEHFADKRVRGEWFELNEEDIEYIKEYLKEYEVRAE